MPKIQLQETELCYSFYCPGCKCRHGFGKTWKFNGDFENPSVSPSILVQWSYGVEPDRVKHRCHSYITDGKIRYLNDCTHDLKGQTIELPNI